MRPLPHPSIEDMTVVDILHALSDPVRIAICVDILNSECSHNCTSDLEVMGQPIAKSTLSLQFKALREGGLIRGERHGSEIHHMSRQAEVDDRFPGLIQGIVDAHKLQAQAKRLVPSERRGHDKEMWDRERAPTSPSKKTTRAVRHPRKLTRST